MLCPSFGVQRQEALAGIAEFLWTFVQLTNLSSDASTQLLLYGDPNFLDDLERSVLNMPSCFIDRPGRFD